jgi:hypothetical protein
MSVPTSCGVSVVDIDCVGVQMKMMVCIFKAASAMLIVSVLCPC